MSRWAWTAPLGRPVEPTNRAEAIVLGCREPGFENRGGLRHVGQEGIDGHGLGALAPSCVQRRFYFTREFGGIDDEAAARILNHVGIVRRTQQRVGRHRHDAGLDSAPEEIKNAGQSFTTISTPVAGLQPPRQQRIARPVHPLGQLGKGHRLLGRADRCLGAAAFPEVPVDERHRHIEPCRQLNRLGGEKEIPDGSAISGPGKDS